MKVKNIGAFIPGLNAKNMTNTASEGAIEKKLNTEKVSTASPAVPEARTTLEESAASEISTTFHPKKLASLCRLSTPKTQLAKRSNLRSTALTRI
jgi:hypothetical protein